MCIRTCVVTLHESATESTELVFAQNGLPNFGSPRDLPGPWVKVFL